MATLAKRQLVEPTYWTCPHGVRVRPSLTYGPAVAEICDKAGYTPDPQQELGLDIVFSIRPDGSPACFSFCIVCARQNLKSGLFQQCVIGWLFVVEVPEVAWSAHELRTSLNAQTELYETLQSPALSKYLPASGRPNPGLYDTNGKERIELNTGQTVWFQTRTRDGGRGLGKPKVIIDEAFKFKKRTSGALLPILLAQHHPQLVYGSSEPPVDDVDAEVLRDVMDRGQGHKSPELGFLQWRAEREPCADPDCTHPKDAMDRGIDCALDREHLLLQANPTVHRDDQGHALDTGRITMRTLRALRQELDPVEYMRECLGWPDEVDANAGPPAIDLKAWSKRAHHEATPPRKAVAVIAVEADQSSASIGVVGQGTIKVEVSDRVFEERPSTVMLEHSAEGTGWVVDRLQRLSKNVELLEVALHPRTQAGALETAIKLAGFEVTPLTNTDYGKGCAGLLMELRSVEPKVAHIDQAALNAVAAVARTRKVGEQLMWDTANSPVPSSPLVATSTALHRWGLVEADALADPPPEIF